MMAGRNHSLELWRDAAGEHTGMQVPAWPEMIMGMEDMRAAGSFWPPFIYVIVFASAFLQKIVPRPGGVTVQTAGEQEYKQALNLLISMFCLLFSHRMITRCFLCGKRPRKKMRRLNCYYLEGICLAECGKGVGITECAEGICIAEYAK